MTNPINLAYEPSQGHLELSFFHIADLMDNTFTNFYPGQGSDYGNVQAQVDLDPDPVVDRWGFWDGLVPFENVYDHVPYIWSSFGIRPTYCNFNPIDGGPDPTAPHGYKELMCHPTGVWSHCGNAYPDQGGDTYDCEGPGLPGTVGSGLWVQSRLSLDAYRGSRVRIRWIAQSWEFDCCAYSYHETGSWDSLHDDGWWIDRITVNGALESPAAAVVDDDPPPGGDIVTDLTIAFSGGSGTVSWRTTSERDLSGFNVIVLDAQDRRVQLNLVLIPCEACVTEEGRSYAFPVPKHKSGRNVFLDVVHRSGAIQTVGPALRQ
jgi:hypothetical protein